MSSTTRSPSEGSMEPTFIPAQASAGMKGGNTKSMPSATTRYYGKNVGNIFHKTSHCIITRIRPPPPP